MGDTIQSHWTLEKIRDKINKLATRINPPSHSLPTYVRTEDGARPHIEVDANGYHYIVVERGQERQHRTTNSLSKLFYWIFKDATFIMALNYELENRIPKQDFRRLMFAKQIELMGMIDPNFGTLCKQEIDEILNRNPYDDSLYQ